jgi:hypothetical protein
LCRFSNDINLKAYYKRYCTVLSKVICTAKKHYNKVILGSKNKMRNTWKIKNEEKGTTKSGNDIQSLVINNKIIMNQNEIANTINNYCITISDTLQPDNKHLI